MISLPIPELPPIEFSFEMFTILMLFLGYTFLLIAWKLDVRAWKMLNKEGIKIMCDIIDLLEWSEIQNGNDFY